MSRLALRRSNQPKDSEPQNPASHLVNIGRVVGRAGPDLVWRIHEAKCITTNEACSVFVLDKKSEKFSKSRRRDLILELLRNEFHNCEMLKSTRFLEVRLGMHENNDYLTFIAEPIYGCLTDAFEEKRVTDFTELDIIFGVYQLTDALRFLHSTQEMMHCNVNPGAVMLAGEGKWKLGGLNFMEKVIDTTKASPRFTGYSAKFPKAAQPNLDFIAPEAQMHNSMSPLADMFSLGMVLCAIYNEGHSLIESDFNPTVYAKRISELPQRFEKISKHLPKALVEPVRKMISEDVRDRPTSQLFALLKIFNEPTVLSYEGLLSLESRSVNQKKEFFNRFAKVVPEYDLVLRYQRILPLLLNWYEKSADLSPFVLPSLLTMIHVAENDDFEAYLREPLMKIMTQRKTLQTSVVFVDLIEFFISRLTKTEIEQYILPELFVCFEPVTNKTTETVQNAISIMPSYLGEDQIQRHIIPKLREMFSQTASGSKLQLCVLECIERLLPSLNSPCVAQEISAFLSTVRTTDSSMLGCILAINRHLLSEQKFGITCPTIAGKLLPPLLDALASPLLGLNDFRLLMDVLRFMLDTVDRQRTCELILRERKSQGGSCSNISTPTGLGRNLPLISMQKPTVDADFVGSDIDDARFSRTSLSDHRHSTGDETSNTRNWLRSNLQLQRLRASGNRSESVLYGLKQRNSLTGPDRYNWSEVASNPTAEIRTPSYASYRANGSYFCIPSPAGGPTAFRRHSGNLPSRSLYSQEPFGSLNVPHTNGRFLDPRRHSYGCSTTASVNSLLTVNVCEGPFVTPFNSRLATHRGTATSLNQSLNRQANTFKRIL
ncbi:hypothetical protein CRM22_004249 [Opisthorchis felineus]|uniref:Protein kinase domain-containing protein n=1 Tax=Opisthorchis felineus TaxID=147828 RepID=A0A4S2LX67_OPIFE|nr:hypothetical protein CRM22_004249 [Opisthorchis felineus]